MKGTLIFLFVYISLFSFGKTVEISGNAAFFRHENIRVLAYENLLHTETRLIAETLISEDGTYQLIFELSSPKELIIQIEMRNLLLHIHPGARIQLDFFPIENAGNQRVPFRVALQTLDSLPNIARETDYDNIQSEFAMHQLIMEKMTIRSSFYTDFFDSIQIEYAKKLSHDSLFATFFTFFKANSLLQTEISKTHLFTTYIWNRPVYYRSKQYLSFFNSVSSRRVFKFFSQHPELVELAKKEYKIYPAFMRMLSADSLLKNEEVRSLALLQYCLSQKKNTLLSLEAKNGIINQISNFCHFPNQKKAALYFQQSNNKFKAGMEAPEIELMDSKGEPTTLSSFRGKHTYLAFINSKSKTCVLDLQVIASIKKKYRKVNFLFIICDRDSLQMENLPSESGHLTYLFVQKNYTPLISYQIWNFPMYYLLDKHGYFIQSPAKNPENIIDDFTPLFAPKSAKKRYEIIKD
ncbi:MAG: hypothetical protein ACI85Q_000420 [Salibacteraceae bacterium]|jgi:hypothetical protein